MKPEGERILAAVRDVISQTTKAFRDIKPAIAKKHGIDDKTIRRNLVAGIRQETGRAGSLKEYLNTAMYSFLTGEVPYLPGPMQPFFSPETAARMMLRGSPEEREQQYRQLTGERPIVVNVRVQMPDGRDLPSTVEGAGVQAR